MKCGIYGHRMEDCPRKAKPNPPTENSPPLPSPEKTRVKAERHKDVSVDEEFGPWMVVKGSPRLRSSRTEPEAKAGEKVNNQAQQVQKNASPPQFSPHDLKLLLISQKGIPVLSWSRFALTKKVSGLAS